MAKNTGTTTFNKCARLFGAFAIIILTVAAAGAATFTVSSTADTGLGTLRQAVTDANAATSNDTIVFNIPAASCNATTGVCTITLASEITISNNGSLTISGTGANRLTIDGGAGTNRIFYALSTILNISGVTLTGGNSTGASFSGQGAAILTNGGTLTLKSVVVTGNSNSTNIESGGAVTMLSGSNHVIINSTISNNTDRDCGGLDFISNTGTVTNTTISGNVINGVGIPVGGGFCVLNGTVTMLNSTVTGNSESDGGSYGGGAAYISGTLNISNSIVAGNIAPVHADFENDGTIISQGYNLIGENSDSSGAFPAGNPNANNDIVGTSGSPVNPLLDALANYGGTIPTRRPQTTSPAIDKGSAVTGVSSDGRGVIRPFDNPSIVNATGGNGADIGAFELETSIIKDWGFNQYGQLGLGNTNDQYTPLTLSGLKDITQFGGGNNHSIVLLADGSVRTSGDNSSGQQGIGTFSGNRSTYGTVMGTNVANITQVSGGGYHSVALRSDGTVWAWGDGFFGQLGNGANDSSGTPVQVGAGNAAFNAHVIAVSAGYGHNLALTDDGKVWAWGFNNAGQLGDGTQINSSVPVVVKVSSGGTQLSGVIQIAAGDSHSVALKSDGTVVVWGYNQFGQVGNGTINTTGCNCVQYPTQTTNTLMGTIVQISAGAYHNVAVNTAGDVYAWGYGGDGRIGDGNTADALIPRKTSIVSNVVRVETHGATQTLARQRDGAIYVWGQNVFGQIGNGTMNNQLTPLNISAVAGTGGNLGTNIAVFGVGVYSSYASTLPETLTPAGTSTLRGDQFSVTFPASTIAGTTQVRTFDPTATGLTVSSGYTIQANSTGYDITSTAQFTGTATVCLAFPNVIDPLTFNRLYILHDDDFDGTLDSRAMSRNYQKRQLCSTTSHFSPFVVALGPAAPTAGEVFVSGRVITDNGRGLLNAIVTLTDSNGVTRTARTSAFGYYHFDDLTAGETVTISVSAKKYSFAPQIVNLSDSLSEVNFTGEARR